MESLPSGGLFYFPALKLKMPYKLSDDKLCVVRADTGEVLKCYKTPEKARDYLTALTKNVQEAGARNSSADMKRIQAAHDLMTECGAMCDGKNAKMTMKEARYIEARKSMRLPEAVSYDAIRAKVSEALEEVYPPGMGMGCWIAELFDEYAIIELGDDYWQVPYTVMGEAVTLADKTQWQQVERQQNWVSVMESHRHQAEALLKWLK